MNVEVRGESVAVWRIAFCAARTKTRSFKALSVLNSCRFCSSHKFAAEMARACLALLTMHTRQSAVGRGDRSRCIFGP